MEVNPPDVRAAGPPRVYWLYLAGAVLVAVGFADFPFIAYHFARTSTVSSVLNLVFYSVAMTLAGSARYYLGTSSTASVSRSWFP